jgi:hypothetical protein
MSVSYSVEGDAGLVIFHILSQCHFVSCEDMHVKPLKQMTAGVTVNLATLSCASIKATPVSGV